MKASVALFTAVITCTAAIAADQPSRNPEDKPMKGTAATFEALDRNSDQYLSLIEASADASLAAQFSTLDKNGDGYVSKSEYVAYARAEARPSR